MSSEERHGREASISYLFKRLVRSWKIFLALLLSIVLASAFFSGVNVGADTVAKKALNNQLSQVPVDIQAYLYSPISAANITEIMNGIRGLDIKEITHIEALSRLWSESQLLDNDRKPYFTIVGIFENSSIYSGLTVRNGSSSLGVNETYVWLDSTNARDIELGDALQFNITVGWEYREPWLQPRMKNLLFNLTVVGFVDLDERLAE